MAFQVSKHRWLCWLLCPQATGSSFCSVAAKGKEKGGKKSKMWHFGKKAVRSRDKDSARNREGGVQGHNLPKNQGLCKVPIDHSFCKALNKEGLCTVLKFNEKIFLIKQRHGTTCTFSLLYQGRNMCAPLRISTTETFLGVKKYRNITFVIVIFEEGWETRVQFSCTYSWKRSLNWQIRPNPQ